MTTTVNQPPDIGWAKAWLKVTQGDLVTCILSRHDHIGPARAEAMIVHLWDRLTKRLMAERGYSLDEAEAYQAAGLAYLCSGRRPVPNSKEQVGLHNLLVYRVECDAVCSVLSGDVVDYTPNDIPGWGGISQGM